MPMSICEGSSLVDCFFEADEILFAGNFPCPELRQVRRDELRVEKFELLFPKPLDQTYERHFRSIPFDAEHRLSEESRPERNAVQAAHKTLFHPCLNAVRISEPVKIHVTPENLPGYPSLLTTGA